MATFEWYEFIWLILGIIGTVGIGIDDFKDKKEFKVKGYVIRWDNFIGYLAMMILGLLTFLFWLAMISSKKNKNNKFLN